MKLIADSGSTKVDWRAILNDGSIKEISTEGINPIFQTEEYIINIFKEHLVPVIGTEVESIYFYGAGIINPEASALLEKYLKAVFTDPTCYTYSDVVAAARALCGKEAGIACIMGTGSNTCFYDGENIAKNVKACGFILGDEGSGAVLGKKLVADYLKGLLPKDIETKFTEKYNLDYGQIVAKVYREAIPSRFLASFSPFINENREHPHIKNLLRGSFDEFFKRNISQYDYKKYPVNLIGSVAFYYQDILEEVAAENGMKIGKILKSPIEGLIEYHK